MKMSYDVPFREIGMGHSRLTAEQAARPAEAIATGPYWFTFTDKSGHTDKGTIKVCAEATGPAHVVSMLTTDVERRADIIADLRRLATDKIKAVSYISAPLLQALKSLVTVPPKKRSKDKDSLKRRRRSHSSVSSHDGDSLDTPDNVKLRSEILALFNDFVRLDMSSRRKLIAEGFFGIVIDLLGLPNESVQLAMLETLKPFMISSAHQKQMVDAGVLKALVDFVASKSTTEKIQLMAFHVLFYFDEEHQKQMLNEGVFKAVLRLLNKGTSQTQTRALEMIQFFNTQYQPNMISAGVLTQLVGLLKMDGNPDKRLLMAKSLSVIANFTKSHIRDLIEAGLLPALVQLLLAHDEKIQTVTFGLIDSFKGDHLEQLIQSKYLDALVSLITPTGHYTRNVCGQAFLRIFTFAKTHPAELKKAGVIGALEEILRCPNDPIDPDDHVIHPAVPLETATAEHFVTFLLVNRLQLTFDEVNRGTILLELDSYIHISNSKPPAIGPFAPIVDTILEEHDHNQGEYLFTLSELTKLIEHLETNYAVDMSEQLAVYDAVFRLFVDSVAIRDTGVYICSKAIITRAMRIPKLRGFLEGRAVYKTILTAAQAFNDVSIFEAAFSDDSWLEPFRSDSKLLDQLAMMVMIKPSTPELLRLNTLVFNMCDRFESADLNAVGYFERLVFLLQSEEFRPFHPRALSVLHRDKIAHLALLELGKARYGHDGMLLISLLNASLMDNSTFTLVLDIINVLPKAKWPVVASEDAVLLYLTRIAGYSKESPCVKFADSAKSEASSVPQGRGTPLAIGLRTKPEAVKLFTPAEASEDEANRAFDLFIRYMRSHPSADDSIYKGLVANLPLLLALFALLQSPHMDMRIKTLKLISGFTPDYHHILVQNGYLHSVFEMILSEQEPVLRELAWDTIKTMQGFSQELVKDSKLFSLYLATIDAHPAIRVSALKHFLTFESSVQDELIPKGFLAALVSMIEKERDWRVQLIMLDVLRILEKYIVQDTGFSSVTVKGELGEDNMPKETQEWINKWTGKTVPYRLLYKASRDGWDAKTFYEKVIDAKPTVTIATHADGAKFGGYTTRSWNSIHDRATKTYLQDDKAFLFSLTDGLSRPPQCMKIKSNKTNAAIFYNPAIGNGPVFGDGHDLMIDLNEKKAHGALGYSYVYPVVTRTFWVPSGDQNLAEVEVYEAEGLANMPVEETSRLSLLPKNFADVLNGWIEGNQPTELMIEQLAPNQAPSNDGDDDDDIEKSAHLWQLKYRASQDGWSGDKWLELCENKGPSITLVKTGRGAIFGGYMNESVERTEGRKVSDEKAFLFTLMDANKSKPHQLGVKQDMYTKALFMDTSGPCWGLGMDLCINLNSRQLSYSNPGRCYSLPIGIEFMSPAALNLFAGSPTDWDIIEVEVYTKVPPTLLAKLRTRKPAYKNLRLILRLIALCSSSKARDAVRKIVSHLVDTKHRKKVVQEMTSIIDNPQELDAVKLVLKDELAGIVIPGYKVVPYQVNSVNGSPFEFLAEVDSNIVSSPTDSLKNSNYSLRQSKEIRTSSSSDFSRSESSSEFASRPQPLFNILPCPIELSESTSHILLQYTGALQPIVITHLQLVVTTDSPDGLDDCEISVFTSDEPITEAQVTSSSSVPAQPVLNKDYLLEVLDALEPIHGEEKHVDVAPAISNDIDLSSALKQTKLINAAATLVLGEDMSPLIKLVTPVSARYIMLRIDAKAALTLKWIGPIGKDLALAAKTLNADKIDTTVKHLLGFDGCILERNFVYQSEFDEKGILYWLGTAQGTKDEWSNPADDGHVAIELSHRTYNQASMKVNDVISRSQQSQVFYWGGSAPQWVSFNFGKISICVSSFTLRHGYNYNNSFPQDFLLQGSVDGEEWVDIFEQLEPPFTRSFQSATFDVLMPEPQYFSWLRIFQRKEYYMGPNIAGAPFLCLYGVEFYGKLRLPRQAKNTPPSED